jgi:hypothetical protein
VHGKESGWMVIALYMFIITFIKGKVDIFIGHYICTKSCQKRDFTFNSVLQRNEP